MKDTKGSDRGSILSGESRNRPLANQPPPHPQDGMHEAAKHGRWTESHPVEAPAKEAAKVPKPDRPNEP
jgi:hypothetical protein